MHYLQLFFRDRKNPILVPVTEEDATRMLESLGDEERTGGFAEVPSVVDHDIWFNTDSLQMVRFLEESHGTAVFDVKSLKPSRHYIGEGDEQPDWDNILWNATFWIKGRGEPIEVGDLDGHDWIKVTTGCDCGKPFIVVTDEDGEELAIRIDDIDLVAGLETERYSDEQFDIAKKLTNAMSSRG